MGGKDANPNSAKKRKKKNISLVVPQQITENESLELVASPIGPIMTYPTSKINADIILDRLRKEIVEKFHYTLSPVGVGVRSSKKSGQGSKRRRIHQNDDDIEEKKARLSRLAKSRIVVGVNSCTRTFRAFYQHQNQGKVHIDVDEQGKNDPSNSNTKSMEINAASKSTDDSLNAEINSSARRPSLCILSRDIRPTTILAHIPFFCQQVGVPILLLPGRASKDLGSMLGGKNASVLLFTERSRSDDDDDGTSSKDNKKSHDLIDSFIEFAKEKIPTYSECH